MIIPSREEEKKRFLEAVRKMPDGEFSIVASGTPFSLFYYTVGLAVTGDVELLICGHGKMPIEEYESLIGAASVFIKRGDLSPEKDFSDPELSMKMRVREVGEKGVRFFCDLSTAFYSGEAKTYWQIFLSDPTGKFVGDEGFDISFLSYDFGIR